MYAYVIPNIDTVFKYLVKVSTTSIKLIVHTAPIFEYSLITCVFGPVDMAPCPHPHDIWDMGVIISLCIDI